ncbi:unnamed protein product [Leptidea sinapis]|uniref:Uncharacterized protein n=1 Tax=Leptidea sinapis TaxID=189913 RepID=A0A5E4Q0G2_9NEOP|nr:unnamed protein product [Leptidea sinapis]
MDEVTELLKTWELPDLIPKLTDENVHTNIISEISKLSQSGKLGALKTKGKRSRENSPSNSSSSSSPGLHLFYENNTPDLNIKFEAAYGQQTNN